MYALAIFFDFGPLGPMVLLAILAAVAILIFLAGFVAGSVATVFVLRRKKSITKPLDSV